MEAAAKLTLFREDADPGQVELQRPTMCLAASDCLLLFCRLYACFRSVFNHEFS